MAASASTSGYANNKSYDVFINHRGPDVKKTFASYLYRRLTSYGLQVFLDNQELEEGRNFDTQIKRAIASASVNISIFSPRYLESEWCMEELYLMLESKSPIIPVFYKVKPSALRRTQDQNIHEKWRKALKSASYITGFELKALNDDEGELLDQVVKCVLKNLKRDLYVADYPVGLDEKAHVFQWNVLSRKPSGRVQVVGIAGPPGVGKTTLAKQLFNIQSSNYGNCCFLFDMTITRSHNKMVLELVIEDEKMKRRALHRLTAVEGVESVSVDLKEMKITVIGEADPVSLTIQLRGFGFTELLSVGPGPRDKFLWL